MLFLIAELAASNKFLRDLLVDKGVLGAEEDILLSEKIIDKDNLRQFYMNTERAFYEKYQKVRYAMENPDHVQRVVEEWEQNEQNPSD